jgi:hypothetical protein
VSSGGVAAEADGARWVSTACDGCGVPGLAVLVPVAADGRPRATSVPSLCARCVNDPEVRGEHERRARE